MIHMRREPGLVDHLFSEWIDMSQFATVVENLYAIPTGKQVPNPAEILGSRRMRQFLEQVRNEFDVIIIDTPPVLAVSDALLISAQVDATVIVCSAGETKIPAVSQDRKSTRLNSSHVAISYAVFCLKKKRKRENYYKQMNK